jgi:uncharacterized membrane protein YecN with MAPEG domain
MNGVSIVTASALLVYMYASLRVGMARGLYGIEAPAITGHPMFDRHYRVQMNTLEQLVVFLPALWMFATVLSATWACALGAVFVAGRILYAITYVIDPKKRTAGFMLGFLANVSLVLGSIYGAFAGLLSG